MLYEFFVDIEEGVEIMNYVQISLIFSIFSIIFIIEFPIFLFIWYNKLTFLLF